MDFDYWVLWGYAVFYCCLAMLAILYLQTCFYQNATNQKFINREDVPIKTRRIRRHRHRCLQETDSEQ